MPIGRLSRLRELLESADGDVAYDLQFGKDHDGRGTLQGSIEAELQLRCQRCVRLFALPVRIELSLALVEGLDEAADLPEAYDPLLIEGRLLRSGELLEDELILAVPPIPRHVGDSCEAPRDASEQGPSNDADADTRPSPFAELAALKRDRSDS